MMNRRGMFEEIGVKPWIAIFVLVIVVLFLGTQAFGGTNGFTNFYKNTLPDWITGADLEAGGVVAYGLEDGVIYSYNGNSLLAIKSDYAWKFNGKEASYNQLQGYFETYYHSPRDFYRYIDLSPFGGLVDSSDPNSKRFFYGLISGFGPSPRSGSTGAFVGVDVRGENHDGSVHSSEFYVFQNGMIEDTTFVNGAPIHKSISSEDQTAFHRSIISGVKNWRDIILESGKCEKYISLFGKDYAVRNLKDVYLVVDLGKPVSGNDKYVGCTTAGPESFTVQLQRTDYFVSKQRIFSLINYIWKQDSSGKHAWHISTQRCTDSVSNCESATEPTIAITSPTNPSYYGIPSSNVRSFENGVADIVDIFDKINLADNYNSITTTKYYLSAKLKTSADSEEIATDIGRFVTYHLVKGSPNSNTPNGFYQFNKGIVISMIVKSKDG